MRIVVQLFAGARQCAGRTTLEVDLPENATVAELKRAIAREVPELTGWLAATRIAVDAEYASDDQVVPPSAEVALIPPVSGGEG